MSRQVWWCLRDVRARSLRQSTAQRRHFSAFRSRLLVRVAIFTQARPHTLFEITPVPGSLTRSTVWGAGGSIRYAHGVPPGQTRGARVGPVRGRPALDGPGARRHPRANLWKLPELRLLGDDQTEIVEGA